ncbi:MAG: hypothetical protein MUC66_05235, partial [Methanolinea sp.]|nr:hypothetical protein [Methanolinea sp.]
MPSPVGTVPTSTYDPNNVAKWGEIDLWITNSLNQWASKVNTSLSSTSNSSPYITMTLIKNNNPVFSDLPIVKNIQNNVWYTIDVMDDAYGLENQLNYPFTLHITNSTSNWIQYRYPVTVGYIP